MINKGIFVFSYPFFCRTQVLLSPTGLILSFFFILNLIPYTIKAQNSSFRAPIIPPHYELSLRSKNSHLKIKEADVRSTFSVFNFDEIQDRAQLVQLAISPSIEMDLLKNLSFSGSGLIGLSSGRVQTRFNNPNFNSLNLNELILTYSPLEILSFDLGALNESKLNTPMLIQDRAFPGIQIRSQNQFSDTFKAELKAQYSIPNSTSYEMDRTHSEPIPAFLTQGVHFDYQGLDWLTITGDIHHFTYKNLPSVVAFQSGRLGNEVSGVDSSQSIFNYEFDGFSQAYQFNFLVSKVVTPKFNLQIIDNSKAPTSRSRSQWTGLEFDFFMKDIIITPAIAYFFAESDSVPALYSDVLLGRNNREGMAYKLKLNFKKPGFSISANYIQANLIETDPIQNNLKTIEFLVELPSVQF